MEKVFCESKMNNLLEEHRLRANSSYDFLEAANWYVLYTKSRHEKFVEERLNEIGIEAFTPKRKIERAWSDRVRVIEEPVFKSYCFAKFPLNNRIDILSQKGVVNIVHFGEQYISIPESVINSLEIVLENQLKLSPYPYLKIGDRVVVKRGPLKGLEGFLIGKRKKNTKMVISVDVIASSAMCVVDGDFVDVA